MSREALLEALQRDAAEALVELRAHGAQCLAERAAARAERLALLQAAEERRREALIASERLARQVATQTETRRLLLAAEGCLAERLRTLAAPLLVELAVDRTDTLLAALAQELPAVEWQVVTVQPREREAVRALFPRAEIRGDAAIGGGLLACADGGRLCVDNTLEKRLARGWDDLLPELCRALEEQHAAADTDSA